MSSEQTLGRKSRRVAPKKKVQGPRARHSIRAAERPIETWAEHLDGQNDLVLALRSLSTLKGLLCVYSGTDVADRDTGTVNPTNIRVLVVVLIHMDGQLCA